MKLTKPKRPPDTLSGYVAVGSVAANRPFCNLTVDMDETATKLAQVNLTMDDKPKGFYRRDFLLNIEKEAQQKWKDLKAFESSPDLSKKKFFATFPYPYMNGFMHIGHGYTMTKAEFAARYGPIDLYRLRLIAH